MYDDGDNMLTKEIYDAGTEETETYLHEYDDANELTKQTLGETDTLFFYDDWGRMISKDQGAYAANYEYRYGDKLKSVTSNFSGEGNVTYKYGGDGKRRERSSPYAAYKWDAGWNMINKEGSGGTLSVTYVYDPGAAVGSILAHISGSNPVTGYYRYYLNDITGSVRRVRDNNESSIAYYEYTPYGDVYRHTGNDMRYRFTGKEWDDNAQMYYFPYRYYSPGIGRWISCEPSGLDGPNLYWYGIADPVGQVDPDGRRVNGAGASVSGTTGVVGGTAGFEVVWDDCCNVGVMLHGGAGYMIGSTSASAAFDVSYAPAAEATIYDLAGWGITAGGSGGAGAYFGVETTIAIPDGVGSIITASGGIGVGGEAHVVPERSIVAGFNPCQVVRKVASRVRQWWRRLVGRGRG